ncbi:MAG TPA: hypothetical protein PLF81_21340 [Candidatus Anammoximicrobium sp.]|nr:hypothetical protein [Candidatus Anammoximicrobium sp.]
MEGGGNGLLLDWQPNGRNGKGTVTARLNGEPIHVDILTLTKDADRARFVKKVCEGRDGINAEAVADELRRMAADLASKASATPAVDDIHELDAGRIVRPERIITPDLSALAVPTMTTRDGRPVGRWLQYLRWPDGRRERRPLGNFIDLQDGRRLWIHPTPAEPTPNTPAGWSARARAEWLRGCPAPDPSELFKRVCERMAFFIDLPQEHAPGIVATLACWSILTYVYSAWDAVPYLYVGGPLGSGKSRVFDILQRLIFRPLGSSNMTAAALFRTLHANGGTLLLDEAERLKQTQSPDVQEILSMLLAGYKRGGTATRLEAVGDSFKTVAFDVFGPKALACIAGLPPALASRAISLTMFRAASGSDKPRRRIDADPDGWQRLRDDLHALAMEHGPTWLQLPKRVDVCPRMSGRDFELWQPLLGVAEWLQEHGARGLLPLLTEHARQTIEASKDDQVADADEILLRILAERRANAETPAPGEILKAAQEAEQNMFRQWTAKGVSNAMKRYGIQTAKSHGTKVYRVALDDLRQIQTRYGLSLGLQSDGDEATETHG